MTIPEHKKPLFVLEMIGIGREEGELASGSITAATLTVNVAFLQITAHAPKMQILNNQIINFYQRAR